MRAGRERHRGPLAEGWRFASQVNRDVEDFSGKRRDQLSLRLAYLVVQAAQHVAHRERLVVLHELRVESGGLLEDPSVIALEEKPALVLEHARLEDQDLGYPGRRDLH